MSSLSSFSPPARGILVAGAFALVIMLIKEAEPILAPILLAAFISIIVFPALLWMRRHGAPKWVAVTVIALILLEAGGLLALMTTGLLEGFKDSMPAYQERLIRISDQYGQWAESVGLLGAREALPELINPDKMATIVSQLLSGASSLVATGLMVLLLVIFALVEAPVLPAKLRAAFQLTAAGEARLTRLLEGVNRYMHIKILTSFATAVCVGLMLWILGIDFAALWSVLAFLLNFVPVVGSILMMIPPVLLGLLQADWQMAALVASGYLVIQVVIGNVIEPRMMGKELDISLLTVLISLFFWGWVLGATGAFLSVPLTTALIIALDASHHTRPFAVLLGSAPSSATESDIRRDGAGL